MQEKKNIEEAIYNIKQLITQRKVAKENFLDDANHRDEILELTNVVDFKKPSNKVVEEVSNEMILEIKKNIEQLREISSKFSNDFKPKTIEELVTNLITPHIIEWLNINLPTIVKNVVDEEIKKITSKK